MNEHRPLATLTECSASRRLVHLDPPEMALQIEAMTITVTEFKIHCLELLRRLEKQREPIEITNRGKVIARLVPPPPEQGEEVKPWERLRGSGRLLAAPGESVLSEGEFDALR